MGNKDKQHFIENRLSNASLPALWGSSKSQHIPEFEDSLVHIETFIF